MTKMTTVARAMQAVKPHIPMIKFPDRAVAVKGIQATTLSPSTPAPPHTEAISRVAPQSSLQALPIYQKPVGYTPRGSGEEWHTLPEKYQRKPISQEEMEYIERGGPE